MKQRFAILIGGLLLAILLVGQIVQAQPSRVGILLHVDSPGFVSNSDIAVNTLRLIKQHLNDVRGVVLVEQDQLVSVQQRLGINLNRETALRDLHAVSSALNLDRLVIISVKISSRFSVTLEAMVFNRHTSHILITSFTTIGPELDAVLERAIKGLVNQLIPLFN